MASIIKHAVEKTYGKKGRRIVELNFKAIDETLASLHQVQLPTSVSSQFDIQSRIGDVAPDFIKRVTGEIIAGRGDALPVIMKLLSQFSSPICFAKRLEAAGANGIALFNRF